MWKYEGASNIQKKNIEKNVHGEKSHKLCLFTSVAAGMLRRKGNESTET